MVDGERLRLSARAVQREHQVSAKLLAERMLTHELLELADQLPVLAELEVGLDATLERDQPKRFQACNRRLRKRLVAEVRSGGPRQSASA